jgi:hypothetical protein
MHQVIYTLHKKHIFFFHSEHPNINSFIRFIPIINTSFLHTFDPFRRLSGRHIIYYIPWYTPFYIALSHNGNRCVFSNRPNDVTSNIRVRSNIAFLFRAKRMYNTIEYNCYLPFYRMISF